MILAVVTPLVLLAQSGAQHSLFYRLGPDATLTPLQPEIGTMKGKSKLGGVGGVKVVTEIPGSRAALRLKASDAQTFVVDVEAYTGVQGTLPDQLPPVQYATLYKLDVKGGKREVVSVDVTNYGIYQKARGQDDARGIPLNFARHDTHAVRIEPRSPLPPGEYGFFTVDPDPYRPTNQFRYYCFGID